MKNYYIALIALIAGFLMTGCHTTSSTIVKGPAGTGICASTNNSPFVTISSAGEAKVLFDDDAYYGYLVAKDKQSGLSVPFGLDVKHKGYGGEKFSEGLGATLAFPGCLAAAAGLVCIIIDSESGAAAPLFCGGSAAVLTGCAVGGISANRNSQLSHRYEFTYTETQSVSFDGLSTTLLHPDPEKQSDARPVVQKKGRTASSPAGSHGTSTVSRKRNAGSSTVRNGKRGGTTPPDVSGVYRGFGSLTLDGVTDEVYDAITIEIARADKDQVRVKVIESGEEYFETPMMFTVTGSGRNGSKLTSDDIEGVVIEINQKGEMVYRHPHVNIDGADYVLTIVADRE